MREKYTARLWPLFGLCRAFLQLVSCVPLWVVLALVWAESLACVLSLCPAGLFGSLWRLFGLCPQSVLLACVLRAFLCLSGPYLGSVLSLCPQLVSCGPFWVALALVRAVSSSCVRSLCPTINERRRETRAGPFFSFVYQPGTCFLRFLVSGYYLGSVVPFWLALALVRAGVLSPSDCVLCASLGRSGLCSGWVLSLRPQLVSCVPFGSFWPLFGLSPQPASSTCVVRAFLGRSGPGSGCVLSLCPQLVS